MNQHKVCDLVFYSFSLFDELFKDEPEFWELASNFYLIRIDYAVDFGGDGWHCFSFSCSCFLYLYQKAGILSDKSGYNG